MKKLALTLLVLVLAPICQADEQKDAELKLLRLQESRNAERVEKAKTSQDVIRASEERELIKQIIREKEKQR